MVSFLKGSFLIKAKEENIVTDKGLRAFIMERLLNSPFARGSVINLDKKTVQVSIEGDEKTIRAFIKNLEKAVIEEFGNPMISFSGFEENASLELPNLIRSSQSLMVGQLQKGVGVQLKILETLNKLPDKLSEKISKKLPRQISEEMSRAIPKQISEEISKTLPNEIAKSIGPEIARAIKEK